MKMYSGAQSKNSHLKCVTLVYPHVLGGWRGEVRSFSAKSHSKFSLMHENHSNCVFTYLLMCEMCSLIHGKHRNCVLHVK